MPSDEECQEQLRKIEAQFQDREVALIVMTDGDKEYPFVMTSPVKEEWKKYRREMTESKDDIEKVEGAIERAALAQIRWPSREDVVKLFTRRPGMIQNFAEELGRLAGANVEVRTKKS